MRFPLVVYKKLKDAALGMADLLEAQPTIGRSLQQMLDFEGDVEATFGVHFQVSYEVFGELKLHEVGVGVCVCVCVWVWVCVCVRVCVWAGSERTTESSIGRTTTPRVCEPRQRSGRVASR